MTISCPKCNSPHIKLRNIARRTGGTIGTVAGATSGVLAIKKGARIGSQAGLILGPIGSPIGAVCGAVITGLICAPTGGSVGLTLGEFVDDNILDNYQCHDCGQRFSTKSNSATPYDSSHSLTENIYDHEDDELDQL